MQAEPGFRLSFWARAQIFPFYWPPSSCGRELCCHPSVFAGAWFWDPLWYQNPWMLKSQSQPSGSTSSTTEDHKHSTRTSLGWIEPAGVEGPLSLIMETKQQFGWRTFHSIWHHSCFCGWATIDCWKGLIYPSWKKGLPASMGSFSMLCIPIAWLCTQWTIRDWVLAWGLGVVLSLFALPNFCYLSVFLGIAVLKVGIHLMLVLFSWDTPIFKMLRFWEAKLKKHKLFSLDTQEKILTQFKMLLPNNSILWILEFI